MALPKFSGKSCERVKITPSYTTLVVSRRKGLTSGLGASLKKTFAEAPQSQLLRSSTRVLPQELPTTQAILPVFPISFKYAPTMSQVAKYKIQIVILYQV